MILLNDRLCALIIEEMNTEMQAELTDWEKEFAASNEFRQTFTDAQKSVINSFREKYDFKSVS